MWEVSGLPYGLVWEVSGLPSGLCVPVDIFIFLALSGGSMGPCKGMESLEDRWQ